MRFKTTTKGRPDCIEDEYPEASVMVDVPTMEILNIALTNEVMEADQ